MTEYVADKLYRQLHYCTNLLQRGHGSQKEHRSHDIHRGQGRTLSLLNENNGISQRALAELLHIRPPSLGELLDKLEANNLIERRQHETDKRISNVFITETGRTTITEIHATRRAHIESCFGGLSADEQKTLSELLDKLLDTLKINLGEEVDTDDDREHHHCRHHHHEKHRRGHGHGRHEQRNCRHEDHSSHHSHHQQSDD